MLHETLLALLGHCGGLFKENENSVELMSDVPFLSISESAVLTNLCTIATKYKVLKSFTDRYADKVSFQSDMNDLYGLYIKWFCRGLRDALNSYVTVISQLEHDLLSDPNLSLCHIHTHVFKFDLLFSALLSLVYDVQATKAHGCYILDIVYKHSHCGASDVQAAIRRIWLVCYKCLNQQLISWMLFCSLRDPYNEFFIQPKDASTLENDRTVDKSNQRSHKVYTICADLLPRFVSTRIAEKVLFVGESIQLIKDHCGKCWENREVEQSFTRRFHLLPNDEFKLTSFETLINDVVNFIAERVWHLVLNKCDFKGELKLVKDYLLLSRGELWEMFIDVVHSLLQVPTTASTDSDCLRALQYSARAFSIDDEHFVSKFKVHVPNDTAHQIHCGWDVITLKYSPPPLLRIIFTPNLLEMYESVFSFMLKIMRVRRSFNKTNLLPGKVTKLQSEIDLQSSSSTDSCTFNEICKVRSHMFFFITTLQFQIEVNVLETLFSKLLKNIADLNNIELIKDCHEQFIASLHSQCFLNSKQMTHVLHEILNLCATFTVLLEGLPKRACLEKIRDVISTFQKQSCLLYEILSRAQNFTHISQLLTLLNYNNFFQNAGYLG